MFSSEPISQVSIEIRIEVKILWLTSKRRIYGRRSTLLHLRDDASCGSHNVRKAV
jgi:hypothetical protein